MRKAIAEVGPGIEFETGYGVRRKRWLKVNFVVEVEGDDSGGGKNGMDICMLSEEKVASLTKGEKTIGFPVVRLNPEEHQDHVWLTERELADCEKRAPDEMNPLGVALVRRGEGGVPLKLVSVEQQEMMVRAFSLYNVSP